MIDIHNHALCGMDDGAKNLQESAAMLRDAAEQGIEAVILTPHCRRGMFAYDIEKMRVEYEALEELAREIGIAIYPGCEYYADSAMVHAFQTGRCHTLADGDYVLTEYGYQTEYSCIRQYTQQVLANGYIPVIAHVERYTCIQKTPKLCAELSEMGAWIQLNADSVLGIDGRRLKHVCKKLLQAEWADMIASDAHGIKERCSHMRQCFAYVAKKYGERYADRLFYRNPQKVIENR